MLLDYLVYAYLQKGDNELAKDRENYLDYRKSCSVDPLNF